MLTIIEWRKLKKIGENPVVAWRFIRTLTTFINIWLQYQKMCIIMNYIVSKYNNKYHIIIKMNPVDVKSSSCFHFEVWSWRPCKNIKT